MRKDTPVGGRSRRAAQTARRELALAALMKFRLVINSTKRHFRWLESRAGVNGAQLWALWEIRQRPGLRVSGLAGAMAVHQSTASNLIERLERAGFIERDRSRDDQRVVRLRLTTAGKALIERVPGPARGMLPEALQNLPLPALRTLDESLGLLLAEMRLHDSGVMHTPLAELLSAR